MSELHPAASSDPVHGLRRGRGAGMGTRRACSSLSAPNRCRSCRSSRVATSTGAGIEKERPRILALPAPANLARNPSPEAPDVRPCPKNCMISAFGSWHPVCFASGGGVSPPQVSWNRKRGIHEQGPRHRDGRLRRRRDRRRGRVAHRRCRSSGLQRHHDQELRLADPGRGVLLPGPALDTAGPQSGRQAGRRRGPELGRLHEVRRRASRQRHDRRDLREQDRSGARPSASGGGLPGRVAPRAHRRHGKADRRDRPGQEHDRARAAVRLVRHTGERRSATASASG